MKRSRVITRSEAARARARPCPVSPDALLALLDDSGVTAGQLLAGSAAVASLTADMVTRKDDSVKLACGDVRAARAAFVHTTKRVAFCARRCARLTFKRADATTELLSVTAKQLRVWGLAQQCVLDGVASGCILTSVHPLVHVYTISTAVCFTKQQQLGLSSLGRVVLGDWLRVVSAAGPGLHLFKPLSHNEFSVVLAQADGSVPVWLMTGDICMSVLTTTVEAPAGAVMSTSAGVGSVLHGTVSLVYGGFTDETSEVDLQLRVCGAVVSDASGDEDWRVKVPRRPLAGHSCAAVGTHIRTLPVVIKDDLGMAVSANEKWLVVFGSRNNFNKGRLSVYSLPGGELVRTFGGVGDGPLQFNGLRRLCFAPNGDVIVVDCGNQRLQEVTLEGVFVRFIGVGAFGDCRPCSVDVHDDIIAVGCCRGTGLRVVLFDFDTGVVTSRFGELGEAPGQLNTFCPGVRFTPDGSHVIIAEGEEKRVSLFTTAGVFVRCVGVGVLGGGSMDVLLSVTGEYVVADIDHQSVCVLSATGSELQRWGRVGTDDGDIFHCPSALAAAGQHLYVLDSVRRRVEVFE